MFFGALHQALIQPFIQPLIQPKDLSTCWLFKSRTAMEEGQGGALQFFVVVGGDACFQRLP
jgi:hypothetical protein